MVEVVVEYFITRLISVNKLIVCVALKMAKECSVYSSCLKIKGFMRLRMILKALVYPVVFRMIE